MWNRYRHGMDDTWVDGNVLAGTMRELLSIDITSVRGRCAGCGRTGPLAEARVYRSAGLVARCPGCEAVLMRVVQASDRVFLDLHGIALLELASNDR
jgi:hypothetical protein